MGILQQVHILQTNSTQSATSVGPTTCEHLTTSAHTTRMYRISDWKSNPHEQNYKMEEGSEVLCGVGRGGEAGEDIYQFHIDFH